MQFLNFRNAGFGLLVKRSGHQRKELCIPDGADDVFGLMVGREFIDEDGRVICYPRVHWEGQGSDSLCHPINVEPVRQHNLPLVTLP